MLPVSPATPQAKKLYRALKEKDVKCILEFYDEHKHVDICIPDAKIHIEIDGDAHFFDHRQIKADALRDSWSEKEGFKTFRFSNEFIDVRLDEVVNEIMKVGKKRNKGGGLMASPLIR
jgi:very-short-patch-repair endonuclease